MNFEKMYEKLARFNFHCFGEILMHMFLQTCVQFLKTFSFILKLKSFWTLTQ